jgi:fructose-1,6-bisphosphatase I
VDYEKCKKSIEGKYIMTEIFDAIKKVSLDISQAIINEDTSYSDQSNSSGDDQLKLDIFCDVLIENEFKKIPTIKIIASEEKEKAQELHKDGKYLIAYDPLDGSSLIDVNLSVGSIFGIYENSFTGPNLVASVYVVFGPRIELVIAHNGIAKMYRYKNNNYKFIQILKLKEKGKHNASGGTQKEWYGFHKQMIDDLFADGYRLRYSGGMVPDLHQILLKGGGLFSYPGTKDQTNGKLRKLFEVFPFAYIYECAGGQAVDEHKRLLDLDCSNPHETTPCFFGSNHEIKIVLDTYARN